MLSGLVVALMSIRLNWSSRALFLLCRALRRVRIHARKDGGIGDNVVLLGARSVDVVTVALQNVFGRNIGSIFMQLRVVENGKKILRYLYN